MDGLEVPHALAGLDVERDQRIREQVVARPPTAIPRGRGRRQRDIDVTELFIGRHRIPRAEVAGDFPRIVAPRVVAELAGPRHHVKRPQELAGFGVEAADVLGRRFLPVAAVTGATRVSGHDDDVAEHEGPGAVVESSGQRLAIGEAQENAPLGAERLHRHASGRIEGVEVFAANREDSAVRAAGAAGPVVNPTS